MKIENIIVIVDVRNSTTEEKKLVQKTFLNQGIKWESCNREIYTKDIEFVTYYFAYRTDGNLFLRCCYSTIENNDIISVEEFLDMAVKLDRNNDAHVHADLMALYAIDAKTTSEPWKLWELRPIGYLKWKECNRNPTWCRNMEYRQKPKTHIVNGVEIPELRVNVLNENEKFYLVNITSEKYYGVVEYLKSNKNLFDLWIERGLVYENSIEGKNACIMHSKALIKK